VLGEEKTPTARLAMGVVLAAQEYCLRRTKGAVSSNDKLFWLFWLYTALYIVVCTMAFLRPNELTKVALHGMWTHSSTHERARGHCICGDGIWVLRSVSKCSLHAVCAQLVR
jgi:hypothetical protein